MNKILKYTLVAVLGISMMSCNKDEFPTYDGEAGLLFGTKQSGSQTVASGAVSSEAIIEYGTLKPVTENNQVKLVYDAAKSTAKPGIDFTLENDGTSTISAGQSLGMFKVKILEAAATATPKVAVFRLSSPTLPLASFNQEYTLSMSLKCFVASKLVGNFSNNPGFWNSPGGGNFNGGTWTFITKPNAPGKIFVQNFLDVGFDLAISYNAAESVFTVDDQFTGSSAAYQGANYEVWVRQRASTTNTVDICGRKVKLDTQYYLKGSNAAYGGDTSETFTGL